MSTGALAVFSRRRRSYDAVVLRAALFDFGGVLLTSPFEAFNRYEAEAGLPPDTIRSINATDPDTNAWARLERGELDLAGFVEAFEAEAAALGHDVDATRVVAGLRGELRPEMVEAVRTVGRRLATALVTNNFRGEDEPSASPMTEVLSLFDVVVESSVVGVRKPEVAFYELTCERLGVEPAECVLLDDLGVNLKPARAMGMTTIKVVEVDRALDELEAAVGFPVR